jgi:hypothetical protein
LLKTLTKEDEEDVKKIAEEMVILPRKENRRHFAFLYAVY